MAIMIRYYMQIWHVNDKKGMTAAALFYNLQATSILVCMQSSPIWILIVPGRSDVMLLSNNENDIGL